MIRKTTNILQGLVFKHKQHLFPIFVIIIAFLGTSLSLHGWSIGMLHQYFGQPGENDSGLVIGSPQSIRSDEWAVLTPKAINQSHVSYDTINTNIGNGEDAAVMIDAPTRDFSTLVMPWNWGFFFLPLGMALALKWWFFVAMLSITVYYFCYRFFTKNIIFCISIAGIFLFSPIVQWTFRGFLIIPISTGLAAVILADVMRQKPAKQNILNVFALAGLLFSFAIVLYPPFQLVTAISVAFFYILYLFSEKNGGIKKLLKQHAMVFIGILFAGVLTAAFIGVHRDAFSAIADAKHPGVRHFSTGSINDPTELFDFWTVGTTRYLDNPFSAEQRKYYEITQNGNESEAAGAVWLTPIFIILASILLYIYRTDRRKRILVAGVLLFNILLLLWFFLPKAEIPLLNQIHPNRSNLFILFATLFSVGVFVKVDLLRKVVQYKKLFISLQGCAVILLGIFIFALLELNRMYPSVFSRTDLVVASFGMASILGAFAFGRYVVAMVVLAVMSFYVNFDVNPVYRGVDSVMKLKAVTTIQEINHRDPGAWFFDGFVTMESLPLLAGVKTYTTNFSYEQPFWNVLDENGSEKSVYNRAAHVVGDIRDKTSVELTAVNRIRINLNPCDDKTKKLGIKYIVATKVGSEYDYAAPCMQYITSVQTKILGELRYYKIVN